MNKFPKNFVALIVLDALSVISAAALLLRGLWQPAMFLIAGLFVFNAVVMPMSLQPKNRESKALEGKGSKVRLLGVAFLVAACVRLAFIAREGPSWPGITGMVAGFLLGGLFLVIAQRSGRNAV